MKCNKCKNEIKENYCNYCGEKISLSKIIINEIINGFWHIISAILFVFAIIGWTVDKSFCEGLLLFLSAIFSSPIAYKIIAKYLKKFNKVYIRILIIIFTFLTGILISPTPENQTDMYQDKSTIAENLSNKEDNTIVENETNKEENEAVKKVDTDNIEDDRDLDSIVDDTMINQFISLGFNIEEATEMQHLFYQMGIKSLSDIHSGNKNTDINKLVAFVAIANNNEKQKFYFTIENRKMFYAGFKSEDLYDSEKGGVLKNINDVHIPETKITLEEYSLLQVLAQDEVKKYLNYPSTASFPLYDGWNAGRSDNNYKVIGKVNAKNGFGVSSKISFSVYFIKDGENFTVDAVEIDGNRVK